MTSARFEVERVSAVRERAKPNTLLLLLTVFRHSCPTADG